MHQREILVLTLGRIYLAPFGRLLRECNHMIHAHGCNCAKFGLESNCGGSQCGGWQWALAQGCLVARGQYIAPVGRVWSQSSHISRDQRHVSRQTCRNGSTHGRGIACCCLIDTLESEVKFLQVWTSVKICSMKDTHGKISSVLSACIVEKKLHDAMIKYKASTYRQ